MKKDIGDALDRLSLDAGRVIGTPLSEEDFADALGAIRFVETKLATHRQNTLKEAPDFQVGTDYEIITTRSNDYTYNVQALMADLTPEGVSLVDLVNAGAVKLEWKISRLRTVCEAVGFNLRFKDGELTDEDQTADGPHVGKYRKPGYTRVVGKEQKSEGS